jgi:hypothetical protein
MENWSERPDAIGYYYRMSPCGQLNVRWGGARGQNWSAYVAGTLIGKYSSKTEAQEAADEYARKTAAA